MINVITIDGQEYTLEELKLASPEVQSKAGEMFFEGKNVPKNYAESVKWLKLAAEQGVA